MIYNPEYTHVTILQNVKNIEKQHQGWKIDWGGFDP